MRCNVIDVNYFSFHVGFTTSSTIITTFKNDDAVQNDNLVCSFPEWMNKHHREWRSVEDGLPGLLQPAPSQRGSTSAAGTITSMHINKRGHSLKFHNSHSSSLESHATCHKLEGKSKHMSKIVAHVKSGW